jgi:integrase
MKTSFFIRKKTDTESYVGIVVNHNYKAFRFSTPYTIGNKDWEKGYPKRTNVTKNLRENLEIIRQKLDAFLEKKIASGEAPTANEIRSQVKAILGKENTPEFKLYLNEYFQHREGKVAPSTMEMTRTAFKFLFEYNQSVEIGDIDRRFAEGFKAFLFKKEMIASSVNIYLSQIKCFFTWVNETEISEKPIGAYFKFEKTEEKTIYALTKEELLVLEEMSLEGTNKLIRDLFLFACYTGLRWIDVRKFSSAQMVNGFIFSKNQKTGTVVSIPVGEKTMRLLEEYNFQFPKTERFCAYHAIKRVFKLAGLNRSVINAHTGKMIPLYDAASFHTSRKTFATLALSAGANPMAVKSVGGWKGDRSFNRYVNLSNATLAQEIGKMSN